MSVFTFTFLVSSFLRMLCTKKEPNFIVLYRWPWQLIACSIGLPVLKFVGLPFRRYDTLSVSAVIGLVTLTFDLLTLKVVRIIVCGMGNLP